MTDDRWRLGVVSFLNSKPLIAGLDVDPRVRLILDVPARLAPRLDSGDVHAALVPVIDVMAEHRDWRIVSDACVGCDGETLTVRVFSRGPAESIRRLHVDGDSHTSVALAQIIWREHYGQTLEIIPFGSVRSADECEAVLLIGDKVVNHGLIGFDVQTDLGSAWKSMTSLPFVFAVWAAPRGFDGSTLAPLLSQARDRGVASAAAIAADFGPALGWPVALAQRYLTARLKFTLGDRQREGMARFLALAKSHDLVDSDKELEFV